MQIFTYILTTDLPISIYGWRCQGRGDGTHHSSQNPWHSMQVMNATSVLDLQFWFQNGLKEHKTATSMILRLLVDVHSYVSKKCALLTVRYLYPSTEIVPARNPTIIEPKGVSIISPAVPTATPPASAAFWMCTWKRQRLVRGFVILQFVT